MSRQIIYSKTVYATTAHSETTGWYWFTVPERLVNAPNKRVLKFFMSAKAERHGPFETADECDAHQKATMGEEMEIGCEVTEGGEWPASWSVH